MSEEEKKGKCLNAVLAFTGLNESTIRTFKEAFANNGVQLGTCVALYTKQAVEYYIKEHKDEVDILIISEFVQQSSAYEAIDLEKLIDINNNLRIVLIVNKERKGTALLNDLLALGIFNILYQDDAYVSRIVDLALEGRTRKEAKLYYGVENINDTSDLANIKSCVEHIVMGGDKETVKERADYIHDRISEKDFEEVMNNLPDDFKNRLKSFSEYLKYFDIKTVKVTESKAVVPGKLLKTISSVGNMLSTETTEEAVIPSVVKQEIQSAVKKAVIGFAGSQQRIGTTHQTILFANHLHSFGYKVAIVESDLCANKSFSTIEKGYDVKKSTDYFTYQEVDYYPNYNLLELSRIFLKDYNFVLIDFGVYNQTIEMEFGRCVARIMITGTKPWETPMLDKILESVSDERVIKEINFLYMFTHDDAKKTIIKNLAKEYKVFFADYTPDPFINEGYPAIKDILDDYMPKEEIIQRKGQLLGKLKKLFE